MESDWFVLDAEVREVISYKALRARLRNGHEFVAFFASGAEAGALAPGDRITVEMSPCDMSKGRIVGRSEGFER
jgi:translation initiation factor IF-1